MITKNWKNIMASSMTNAGTAKGLLPIKDKTNTVYYASVFGQSYALQLGTNIVVGSGNTMPTEDDYVLESPVTISSSGPLAGSVVASRNLDTSGNPQLILDVTLTNTSENEITVSEIGFFQSIAGYSQGGTSGYSTRSVLLDRTLLASPVTIPAGDYATIRYTITIELE